MRLVDDQGSSLWLAYAMNVHPGGDAGALERALDETVLPLRRRLGLAGPLGLALRLSAAGVAALERDPATIRRLGERFARDALVPFTGNAFVLGDFHAPGVKEGVYAPPWGDPRRTRYTLGFARLLAAWNAPGSDVSLSTAPGSWRGWPAAPDASARRAAALAETARGLRALGAETGVRVRLGLEPEPGCTLETVSDVLDFFAGPLAEALGDDAPAAAHLGVCYDACHQAVVHEDGPEGLARLRAAGIAVVKFQVSSALEVADPAQAEARAALGAFAEPVYLHQVGVPEPSGPAAVIPDLAPALADAALGSRRPWRVHFHVPVHRERIGPALGTTRAGLARTLGAALAARDTPHLEVETYTWGVLPEAERGAGLVEGLARELEWTLGVVRAAGYRPVGAPGP